MIIGPQHTNMANIINASEIFSFAETLSRLLKKPDLLTLNNAITNLFFV